MPTIAGFSIPTEEFALWETLERRPDLEFEVDRVVAHGTARGMPFVWVSNGKLEDLTSILDADPSVETVDLLSEDDSGRFYRLEWSNKAEIIGYMVIEHDATVQRAIAANGEWTLRVMFPERNGISATDVFATERALSFSLDRVYDIDDIHPGQSPTAYLRSACPPPQSCSCP